MDNLAYTIKSSNSVSPPTLESRNPVVNPQSLTLSAPPLCGGRQQAMALLSRSQSLPRTLSTATLISTTAVMSSEWTKVMPVSSEVKDMCNKVKQQIELGAGVSFTTYHPQNYITKTDQNPATNTFVVKVDTGNYQCVHAKILETGQGFTVPEVKYPLPISEPLVPF
ncbi:uncharacterized protein [Danio rerio]|uniref:Uncharacterized protein n=1 Tax=Danio rerio TaxID=7955 RepID=A0AB32TRH0_DANRE